ncbi:MAG: hypothetical protein EOO90_19820 [Pedobacter sp.]|nr:MAG: hypothetical protein EOO90_19820 [Pedobacter sp.]
MKKENKEKENPKSSGDAKGKASFDQNGEGNSPKYAQAGEGDSEETGGLENQAFNAEKSKKED